jgi:hypothetical protein
VSRWQLEPLTFTPFLDRVSSERLVDLYAYRPTDVEAILEFDRRISDRYACLCADRGEYYAGPFGSSALGPEWIVEVSTYASDDPTVVDEELGAAPLGDELQAIVDECRGLQNRETIRYQLRMIPRLQV